MPSETAARPVSTTTARSLAFVEQRRHRADELGRKLARLTSDPEAFAAALRRGLAPLGNPEHLAGQRRVAPGIGPLQGVPSTLLTAVRHGFGRASRGTSTDQLLVVADRLLREEHQESRWFAIWMLEGTLDDDPERTWQLLRSVARGAREWITVDTLARATGRGILLEPFRWAELEQLAYSPSPWERRLIGSTIATLPFIDHDRGRRPEIAARGLRLLGDLLGDAEPDVQKALAWAYRSLLLVDRPAVETALAAEAAAAAARVDGHRAWVVRDALAKLDPRLADRLRALLAGIRRRAAAPATSRAAGTVAAFGVLPDPANHPQPPLFASQEAAR
jgi:3-methyladenine DNA glycosylase AlkD